MSGPTKSQNNLKITNRSTLVGNLSEVACEAHCEGDAGCTQFAYAPEAVPMTTNAPEAAVAVTCAQKVCWTRHGGVAGSPTDPWRNLDCNSTMMAQNEVRTALVPHSYHTRATRVPSDAGPCS